MPQKTDLTAPDYQVLAAVGKKILQPGGRSATETLLEWANFQPGETVLELSSNFGNSAIALARQYQVKVVGIEKNPDTVAYARTNIAATGLGSRIEIIEGNVLHLENLHEKFDYVLAKSILTAQSPTGKAKILENIRDHLKPGGKLLCHELVAQQREAEIHQVLSEITRSNSTPLSETNWIATCQTAGLVVQHHQIGGMSLLNPWHVLPYEGGQSTIRFLWNLCTQVLLSKQVLAMHYVFQKYKEELGYIIFSASLAPKYSLSG
jgi:predicted O-methyltransferase YrrM